MVPFSDSKLLDQLFCKEVTDVPQANISYHTNLTRHHQLWVEQRKRGKSHSHFHPARLMTVAYKA